MADEDSPIIEDILLNTGANYFEDNEDGSTNDEKQFDCLASSLMFNSEGEEESRSLNEIMSEYDFDPVDISLDFAENHSPLIKMEYSEPISLSFINPPESYYHVRYASEITDSPLNGSLVNTQMKTKKNLSGRYLKGAFGRFITITLPKVLFNYSNSYIRVTRLTVPYQDILFIHPYPLLYSSKKKTSRSHVISTGSSIYFKVTKDEIRSCSKQFPNIILTRRKQSDLNKMNNLYSFDSNGMSHPFIGDNAKNKIARYHLQKSVLEFHLVNFDEQTQEFQDTGIFCRSNALLEAEGVKWRRSSS